MMVFMDNLGQAETLVERSMFGKPLKNSKMIGLTIHCFWNKVFATQWHVHEFGLKMGYPQVLIV